MKKIWGRKEKGVASFPSETSTASISSLMNNVSSRRQYKADQREYLQAKSSLKEEESELYDQFESLTTENSSSIDDSTLVSNSLASSRMSIQKSTSGNNSVNSTPDSSKRKILKSLASKRSTTNLNNQNGPDQRNLKSTLSLVDPNWDLETIKLGWLNRDTSPSNTGESEDKMKLCRAELRGSTMYIYKIPNEIADIKSFKAGTTTRTENHQFNGKSLDEKPTASRDTVIKSNLASSDNFVGNVDQVSEKTPVSKYNFESRSIDTSISDLQYDSEEDNDHDNASSSVVTTNSAFNEEDIKSLRGQRSISNLNMSFEDLGSQTSLNRINKAVSNHSLENIKLSYTSVRYPHPDLTIQESTGTVLKVTIESICHAVLFSPYIDTARRLLQVIPLLFDMNIAIIYFTKYFELFISLTHDSAETSRKHESVLIPSDSTNNMIERMKFIIGHIKTDYSGMLLEPTIYKSLWNMILVLDVHSNCDQLKMDIHQKEKSLAALLDFENVNHVLQLDNFSAEEFANSDMAQLSKEINAINLKFNGVWDARNDPSLLYESTQEVYTYYRKNPLIFDMNKNIHWLGRLMTFHLFDDSKYSKSPALRAKVLTKWLELGSYFDKIGDMVSWLAIATLACSMPILRLSRTWSYVDEQHIKMVSTKWAPVVFELDKRSYVSSTNNKSSYHVIAPQGIGKIYPKEDVIPYYGDLLFKKPAELSGDVVPLCEKHIFKIDAAFNRWNEYLQLIENDTSLNGASKSINNFADSVFTDKLNALMNTHIAMQPLTLETVMDKSLATEMSQTSKCSNYHNKARSPLFLGSYASILFPDIVDCYKIYDQQALFGALGGNVNTSSNIVFSDYANQSFLTKKESVDDLKNGSSNTANEDTAAGTAPGATGTEIVSGRNYFLKNVRDLFDVDSANFHVHDYIIFKTLSSKENTRQDVKRKKNGLSRPSSILLSESANVKRFSSYSSSSFNFDDHSFLNSSAGVDPNTIGTPQVSVEILTKAASLDKLIDLLVLTSSIFGSEIKQEDVKDYLGVQRLTDSVLFKMDNGVFTVTFFATYRGFCSTATLLEKLTKRFAGASRAAVSITERNSKGAKKDLDLNDFPNWYVDSDTEANKTPLSTASVNWKYVAQIEIGILEVLNILVQDYYDHFVDDIKNKTAFDNLLRLIENEINAQWAKVMSWLEVNDLLTAEIQQLYDQIVALYKKMRKTYIKNSYKPRLNSSNVIEFTSSEGIPKDMNFPTTFNEIEKYVCEFDKFIEPYFKDISVRDWLNAFEMLEGHVAKSSLNLSSYDVQKVSTPEDHLLISNVYDWIFTLTDVTSSGKSASTFRKLPLSIRNLIRLFFRYKYFITAKIVDSGLTNSERIQVMSSVLQMIQITRVKMKFNSLFDANDLCSSRIRSFMESCLVYAATSPESRAFASSWIESASLLTDNKITSFNSILDLLPDDDAIEASLRKRTPSIPCAGWVLERLIEIICFIPNMSIENTKLINFDKRRFAYNCITNIVDITLAADDSEEYFDDSTEEYHQVNDTKFQFITKLEVSKFDLKKILDSTSDLRVAGAWRLTIAQQYRLLKVEAARRTLLLKQESQRSTRVRNGAPLGSKMSSHVETQKSQYSNKLSSRSQPAVPERNARGNKFNISGLFNKASRPFSIGGFSQVQSERIVETDELPDIYSFGEPNMKPYLQIHLKDFTIFPVYRVPSGFKISSGTVELVEYFFQAQNEADKEDWIYKANYAKRHWFLSKRANEHASNNAVFGMPIDHVSMREEKPIPSVIEKILAEIEYRGLEEVGIYRKSGSLSLIKNIKSVIDQDGDLNMETRLVFDVHNLSGCIKLYLRELPEPLIPDDLVPDFINIKDNLGSDNFETRMGLYHETLPKLPYYNYNLLQRLIRHLKLISEYSEINKMTSTNLATVLGGTFLEGAKPETVKNNFGLMNFVCDDMILNFDTIFSIENGN